MFQFVMQITKASEGDSLNTLFESVDLTWGGGYVKFCEHAVCCPSWDMFLHVKPGLLSLKKACCNRVVPPSITNPKEL